ncbi:hypothetical protein BGX38DRAFT_1149530, partial [Terfezia claveryi]
MYSRLYLYTYMYMPIHTRPITRPIHPQLCFHTNTHECLYPMYTYKIKIRPPSHSHLVSYTIILKKKNVNTNTYHQHSL